MRKFVSSAVTTLSLTMVSLAYGTPVLANDEELSRDIDLGIPTEWKGKVPEDVEVGTLVGNTIQILLIVGAVFFFIYLIIGGIKWIMSGGDKVQIEAARNQITHAIIGLLIVLGIWIIHGILKSVFGIDILDLKIPSFKKE